MRAVAIVLLACQLSACTSTWRLETLAPADVVTQQQPSKLRVYRADGRRETWYRPGLRGDTLVGWWRTDGDTPDRAMPVADIRQVATSHTNVPVVVLLGLTAAALIAAGIALGSWDGPLGGCCSQ